MDDMSQVLTQLGQLKLREKVQIKLEIYVNDNKSKTLAENAIKFIEEASDEDLRRVSIKINILD